MPPRYAGDPLSSLTASRTIRARLEPPSCYHYVCVTAVFRHKSGRQCPGRVSIAARSMAHPCEGSTRTQTRDDRAPRCGSNGARVGLTRAYPLDAARDERPLPAKNNGGVSRRHQPERKRGAACDGFRVHPAFAALQTVRLRSKVPSKRSAALWQPLRDRTLLLHGCYHG